MIFFLHTTDKAPYFANIYKVQIRLRKSKNSKEIGNIYSQFSMRFVGTNGETRTKDLDFNLSKNKFCKKCTLHNKTENFILDIQGGNEIGELKQVLFRWKNLKSDAWIKYNYVETNLHIKRIKIFDVLAQKKYLFVPEIETKHLKKSEMVIKPDTEYVFSRSYKNKRKTNGSKIA